MGSNGGGSAREVVIVAAVRTPIGSLNGSLASLSATELGALALKEALRRSKLPADEVDELYFGNVLSADLGQAPARQTATHAGLPPSCVCTTVNKVCASGLKAVTLGAQCIMCGSADVVAAVGAESMSRAPYYVQGARSGFKFGHKQFIDGLLRDGLWDSFSDCHMGAFAERCAEKYGITREQQDEYASRSYRRAEGALASGAVDAEIVPVHVRDRREGHVVIREDEEVGRVDYEKMSKLRPSFKSEGGTVTAANASSLNDGAAAVLLMAADRAAELGIEPLARLLAFADAESAPEDFTTAPSEAIPKALKRARVSASAVDYFEVNEAFSVVALANQKILGLPDSAMNVFGGAVALGHPLGCSGARVLVTLLNVLRQRGARTGVAAVCNGGGGSTAVVVQRTTPET